MCFRELLLGILGEARVLLGVRLPGGGVVVDRRRPRVVGQRLIDHLPVESLRDRGVVDAAHREDQHRREQRREENDHSGQNREQITHVLFPL